MNDREILNTIKYQDKEGNNIVIPREMISFLTSDRQNTPRILSNIIKQNPLRIIPTCRYLLGTSGIGILPKVERHDLIKSFLPEIEKIETMTMVGKNGIEYKLYVGGNLFLMEMNYVCYEQILYGEGYTKNYNDVKGKTIIDAGSNIGGFSLFAVKNGAKKVYAFEPILLSSEIIKKNAILNGCEKNIIVYPIALGDTSGSIKMITDGVPGDVCASIILDRPGANTVDVKIDTLDSFAKNIKFNFIKMDVEGFENNILIGGKETIKKNKPMMVICSYHKKDDMTVLPNTVYSINKNYKIQTIEDGGEKKIRCTLK